MPVNSVSFDALGNDYLAVATDDKVIVYYNPNEEDNDRTNEVWEINSTINTKQKSNDKSSIQSRLYAPKQYTNKFAAKITNFNPSSDTQKSMSIALASTAQPPLLLLKTRKKLSRNSPIKTSTSSTTRRKAGYTSMKMA